LLAQSTPPPADDSQVVTVPQHPQDRAALTATAWKMLEDALADDKHPDTRTQALAALSTMGNNPRAGKMITSAFADKEPDVRTAAVLAVGLTKNRMLIPALRHMLDDKEPQVAFAAATTLWKLGDHSGQDFLVAVVDGDRPATPGMVHGSMLAANKKLHDPAALARLGALEGAQLLLGPFGFGISAYEYMKRNGGTGSPRVTAIEDLSQIKSPAVRSEMLGAVTDKDPAVRATAAKALSSYHDPDVNQALAMLFTDSKKPVQLAGAAAYLISSGAVATPVRQPSAQ
jgi:HEAT repeat protein